MVVQCVGVIGVVQGEKKRMQPAGDLYFFSSELHPKSFRNLLLSFFPTESLLVKTRECQ